jgi:hypothetical protein
MQTSPRPYLKTSTPSSTQPPPGGATDESYKTACVDGPRKLLSTLAPRNAPRRFVLVSSTGVYGQKNGEWVDEFARLSGIYVPAGPARSNGRSTNRPATKTSPATPPASTVTTAPARLRSTTAPDKHLSEIGRGGMLE